MKVTITDWEDGVTVVEEVEELKSVSYDGGRFYINGDRVTMVSHDFTVEFSEEKN